MIIRYAKKSDFKEIADLIYDTIHTVCANDYTPLQLKAWAPGRFDSDRFAASLDGCCNLVAVEGEKIIGFISTDCCGYVNRLFTHKDYLHRGTATRLLEETEKWAQSVNIETLVLDSSKTAKQFYLNRGFSDEGANVLHRGDVKFISALMKKTLSEGN